MPKRLQKGDIVMVGYDYDESVRDIAIYLEQLQSGKHLVLDSVVRLPDKDFKFNLAEYEKVTFLGSHGSEVAFNYEEQV